MTQSPGTVTVCRHILGRCRSVVQKPCTCWTLRSRSRGLRRRESGYGAVRVRVRVVIVDAKTPHTPGIRGTKLVDSLGCASGTIVASISADTSATPSRVFPPLHARVTTPSLKKSRVASIRMRSPRPCMTRETPTRTS